MRFGGYRFVWLCLEGVCLVFPLPSWFCRSRGCLAVFARAGSLASSRPLSFAAGSALRTHLSSLVPSPRSAPVPHCDKAGEAEAEAARSDRWSSLTHLSPIAALFASLLQIDLQGTTMHANRVAPPQPHPQKQQQPSASAASSKSSPLSSLQAGLHAYRARAKEQWKAHAFYLALAPSRSGGDGGGDGSAGGVAGQWRPDQGGGRCCSTMRRWIQRRAAWLRAHLAALGGSREQELGSSNSNKTRERTAWSVAVLALIALLLIWWIWLR